MKLFDAILLSFLAITGGFFIGFMMACHEENGSKSYFEMLMQSSRFIINASLFFLFLPITVLFFKKVKYCLLYALIRGAEKDYEDKKCKIHISENDRESLTNALMSMVNKSSLFLLAAKATQMYFLNFNTFLSSTLKITSELIKRKNRRKRVSHIEIREKLTEKYNVPLYRASYNKLSLPCL